MKYSEEYGDLIELARSGRFDVIIHQANCFHVMEGGIAKKIKQAFPGAYEADIKTPKGDYNKVGTYSLWSPVPGSMTSPEQIYPTVINAYSQYGYGTDKKRTDYDALRLILRKVNVQFKGLHIGMPKIGCGLAGGDWTIVKKIIQEELVNMDVTVVFLPS